MSNDFIQMMTETFEGHAQETENGIEYWLARDLQHLLGYAEWRNFLNVVTKAKTACEVSGHVIRDHFVDTNKMVELGSGSRREINDIMLTRYACYLIAQNGDPAKQDIAFAQTYFAMQTRKAELIEQRLLEGERVSARKKLSATEKELSDIIYEQTGGNQNFALIRSKGDQALFGKSTRAVKAQWLVPNNRPLADFAPTIILKAKDFFSTGIPVCILVLKKCKKSDDVLFINASEYFEKGKRQNLLLPEHIEKIVDTYQHRKEEKRYSRCVSMEEIEKNDYNLNISRYISTAKPEKIIKLDEVYKKLIDLEKEITTAKNKHNEYLKELGLPLLP